MIFCFCVFFNTIDQPRDIKFQPKTIDPSTRLWGITTEFVGFIPLEPRAAVNCFRLNFNISKLVYRVGKCAKTWNHDRNSYRKSFSNPLSPFQSWKMVKYKLVLDESDLSTLHRGGEGKMCKEWSFPTLVTNIQVPVRSSDYKYDLMIGLSLFTFTFPFLYVTVPFKSNFIFISCSCCKRRCVVSDFCRFSVMFNMELHLHFIMLLLQVSPGSELWHAEKSTERSKNSPELTLNIQALLYLKDNALQLLPQKTNIGCGFTLLSNQLELITHKITIIKQLFREKKLTLSVLSISILFNY